MEPSLCESSKRKLVSETFPPLACEIERLSQTDKKYWDEDWKKTTSGAIDKLYQCWEKIYFNGDGEQLASKIVDAKPEFLHALHGFMVTILSGKTCSIK